jgi:5'-nucleotidase
MRRLYLDMDNVLVDFPSAIDHLDALTLQEYEGRLDEVPGIFSLMEPMPGAIEAFHTLAECFDTYILSTAPWLNSTAWSDKHAWIQTHLGIQGRAHKRLILSHHKNLLKGEFLVDDRTANGAKDFEGELILFGSPRFPGWTEVLEYLENRA